VARCGKHGAVWNDQQDYCPECEIAKWKAELRAEKAENMTLRLRDRPTLIPELEDEIKGLSTRLSDAEAEIGRLKTWNADAAKVIAEKVGEIALLTADAWRRDTRLEPERDSVLDIWRERRAGEARREKSLSLLRREIAEKVWAVSRDASVASFAGVTGKWLPLRVLAQLADEIEAGR
jgi:hypothetical protein